MLGQVRGGRLGRQLADAGQRWLAGAQTRSEDQREPRSCGERSAEGQLKGRRLLSTGTGQQEAGGAGSGSGGHTGPEATGGPGSGTSCLLL